MYTKKLTLLNLVIGAGLSSLLLAFLTSNVSAQSVLQNTNSGLQSQSAPAQNSFNTQEQSGGVQNNNGSSALTQTNKSPLSVYSSPTQTAPEAVVAPSTTLKTDLTKKNRDYTYVLLIGLWIVLLVSVFLTRRKLQAISPNTIEAFGTENEPASQAIITDQKPKKKFPKKKKRKKSHHR